MTDYRTVNRANWDERAPAHAASPDYGLDRFAADPAYLHPVVRFDLPRLGDVRGLRGVHLQCHIGTDTISLSRLGARMTGLDFSPAAIAEARRLAERLDDPTEFVESDVYGAADVLPNESYDLVFTGIGALCWLPSVDRWAAVVARLLKPGGRLFIREGHPMLWTLDDARPDLLVVRYPYFETAEPMVFEDGGTYVNTDAVFTQNVTHEWNHGLGEIVTALLAHGLRLTALEEHDSAPWEALPGRMTLGDDDEWRLVEGRARVPLTYTLQAVKMDG
ncbi:class I SAM-dependent methyltransferase [Asanoa sp. WMMD1127]|uniref:class I SAM-dependent methyltransferase n=1 Tax=Asanoa sp. WMMD1127 TaxID=3016107 RepID=UPI0024171617|nr:class I SAM-dependent methyltransferase [Asanoa sp. WMMD1127]MDG4825969.1 class I SAM-dependent methyltransferase [Asanoa sp. WMMD1127]